MSHSIDRSHYAALFGPTTGDRVRLGDTGLSSPKSNAITRSTATSASSAAARCCATAWARRRASSDAGRARLRHHQRADRRLDRHLQGRRRHQARAHRRHRQGAAIPTSWPASRPVWSSASPPRPSPAKGSILTAGGIDAHIHFICAAAGLSTALASGVTTFIGGGTGTGDRHQRDDLHAGRAAHPS